MTNTRGDLSLSREQNSRRVKTVVVPDDHGHVVISRRQNRKGAGSDFQNINGNTTSVHIVRTPLFWIIERILERGKNVKTISCTPRAFASYVREEHLALCRARGVALIGHSHRPDLILDDEEIARLVVARPDYKRGQEFLRKLEGEAMLLFQELLEIENEAARMAKRYFCLDGEPFIPHFKIAELFGLGTAKRALVANRINAVLHYLDPSSFKANTDKIRSAVATIRRDVAEYHASRGVLQAAD